MSVPRLFSLFSAVFLFVSQAYAQEQVRQQGEFQIATIIVDKANLKAFPKSDSSTLMVVSKGTILTVEFSHNEWTWVLTPTGKHAWLKNSDLNLSKTSVATMGQSKLEALSKKPKPSAEELPGKGSPPKHWKEFWFNDIKYYIVPL